MSGGRKMMFWIFIIIIVLIVLSIIVLIVLSLGHLANSFEKEKENLSKQYGPITKIIKQDVCMSIEQCLIVFEESNKIWICGDIFDYKDIKGCSVSENETAHRANVTYTTKTSTGSLVGRALVGGMIKGVDGAAIGAASATKKTEVKRDGEDYVSVSYDVMIYINSIKTPVKQIPCGNNVLMKEEIIGLIDIIMRLVDNNKKYDKNGN